MTAMVIFRDDTCMVWSSSHSPQRVSFAGCILLFIRTWIVSSAAFTDWVFPCCASSDDAPWVNFYNFG